jgi:hypothetical protein
MNPTPKFLLVEPKSKAIAHNIALMKWARRASLQGHEFQYVRGTVYPKNAPDVCYFELLQKRAESLE